MNSWYMYGVLVLSAIFGYGGYEIIPWAKMDSSAWASWVQAIGSILAVGAAAWVAVYQKRNADRQAELDKLLSRVDKLEAVHAIAVAAYKLVCDLGEAFSTNRASYYFNENFSATPFFHAHSAIKAIPLHELGSYSIVAGFMDLADALAQAIDFVNERRDQPVVLTNGENYEAYIKPIVEKAERGYRDVQSDASGAKMVYKEALRS